jgi:hypothetical protein
MKVSSFTLEKYVDPVKVEIEFTNEIGGLYYERDAETLYRFLYEYVPSGTLKRLLEKLKKLEEKGEI